MKLHLEEITLENWLHCVNLRVTPNQTRFLAPNVYALAECKFRPELIPLGIYDDQTMVGMVVCSYNESAREGWVHRLIIGEGFENRGYSTNTMQWIIRRFRRIPGCERLAVAWNPHNTIIGDFYKSYGFKETGLNTPQGDVLATLTLASRDSKERRRIEPLPADATRDGLVAELSPDDSDILFGPSDSSVSESLRPAEANQP